MKMTTDIKYKYYEFSEEDNGYCALIAAKSRDEAIVDYYDYYGDVLGDDYDYEVVCKELPSSEAWYKLINADLSEESTIPELLRTFDEPGVLLI